MFTSYSRAFYCHFLTCKGVRILTATQAMALFAMNKGTVSAVFASALVHTRAPRVKNVPRVQPRVIFTRAVSGVRYLELAQ